MAVKERKTIDPRTQPGACVRTPGGLRAYVLHLDPENVDRVIIEYESKELGKDNYLFDRLKLVAPAPEEPPTRKPPSKRNAQKATSKFKNGDRVSLTWENRKPKVIPWCVQKGLEVTLCDVRVATDEAISGQLEYKVHLVGEGGGGWIWVLEENLKAIEPTAIATVEPSSLDTAATTIVNLWLESENAQQVADQASYSALDSAKLCGEELLKAKAEKGHGNWEAFRATLIHPRTGKSMPSSTATLYQRIAGDWEKIQSSEVRSLRGARELLKSDRQLSAAKEKSTTTKSVTVADLNEEAPIVSSDRLSDEAPNTECAASIISPDYGDDVSEEIAQGLMNIGVMPCKPSITPEEFHREMYGDIDQPTESSDRVNDKVSIINPRSQKVRFKVHGKPKEGVVVGVMICWESKCIDAVKIDYPGGQVQMSIGVVEFVEESK